MLRLKCPAPSVGTCDSLDADGMSWHITICTAFFGLQPCDTV